MRKNKTAKTTKTKKMAGYAGLAAALDQHLSSHGAVSFKVKNGEVFIFTTEKLESILESSRKKDRVMIFVVK